MARICHWITQCRIKYNKNCIKRVKSVYWESETLTSVEDINLVGLMVIFIITTKDVEMSTAINGVACMTPPLPWPFTFFSYHRVLHLNFLLPDHFLLEKESIWIGHANGRRLKGQIIVRVKKNQISRRGKSKGQFVLDFFLKKKNSYFLN